MKSVDGLDHEKRLPRIHRLSIGPLDLGNSTGHRRLHFGEQLHRLEQGDGLTLFDDRADLDKRIRFGAGGPIEDPGNLGFYLDWT